MAKRRKPPRKSPAGKKKTAAARKKAPATKKRAPAKSKTGKPKKRALLSWELGEGLGHVSDLLETAGKLKANGWEVIYSGRDFQARSAQVAEVFDYLVPSPFLHSTRPGKPFAAASFADVLALYGFSSSDFLMPVVRACDGLLHFVEPSVIIVDFSPMLTLSAYREIPVITVGAPFYNPPSELKAYPNIAKAPGYGMPEPELLENVKTVQRLRGRPEPDRLPEVVAGAEQIITVIPEFDLYRSIRSRPALGPVRPLEGSPSEFPAERKLFVYLAIDFPPTAKFLEALCQSGVPAVAYIRDAPDELRQKLRERGVMASDKPLPMIETLGESWGIVHHGGAGTLHQAAALGRPQLLLPRHLEQAINCSHICGEGLGMRVDPNAEAADMAEVIRQFAANDGLGESAQRFGHSIQDRIPFPSLETIVETAEKLL